MKLARSKKLAMTGLGVFLGFMAVCTVVAKGIYASGLPRVGCAKPYSAGLVHKIEGNAAVRQGQEYGIYVDEGLLVGLLSVGKGDTFEAGQALLRIEPGDLEDMAAECRLELAKLEARQADAARTEKEVSRERQQRVARAREDYNAVISAADAQVQSCLQKLEAAQAELARYDNYLSQTSAGYDVETAYAGQEKRNQLVQTAVACQVALDDAQREKEANLRAAARELEDAEASVKSGGAVLDADLLALDAEQQRKKLEELEGLLAQGGWIYAEESGLVVDCRLKVGERTQDGAGILYAREDGERILEAVFDQEEAKYLSQGILFQMGGIGNDGTRISGEALLEYLENGGGGTVYGKLSMGEIRLPIGQTVELSYQTQTSAYDLCVPIECVYREGENQYYVYVAEEREGILGTEWRVRKVKVALLDQNDREAAIHSAELSLESRVVSQSDKELNDGIVVRML